MDFLDIREQYQSEFLQALQSTINQMSARGKRISFVLGESEELGKYMSSALDEQWSELRGMEIQVASIQQLDYDEDSNELIKMRNQGAMLSDPTIREGYVQGAVARGMEAAGSNANGAMAGFMGMGMGMNAAGNMMGAASSTNLAQMQMMQQQNGAAQVNPQGMAMGVSQQPQQPRSAGWTCSCGQVNNGKFCSNCGKPAPAADWTCSCGQVNSGNFCSNCGKPRA